MRTLIVIALAVAFLGLFTGCCGPGPTFTLRNPMLIDNEPASAAGARLMAVPTYYAPSYTPAAAPSVPAGYASPCN
jgi:hypothetical protein